MSVPKVLPRSRRRSDGGIPQHKIKDGLCDWGGISSHRNIGLKNFGKKFYKLSAYGKTLGKSHGDLAGGFGNLEHSSYLCSMLTKDDIRARGWVHRGGFFWELPWNTDCDEISNRGLGWRLNWVAPGKYLKIECYERNAFEWETAYMGPCEGAEQLDIIMGLLKLGQKSELYTDPAPWKQ